MLIPNSYIGISILPVIDYWVQYSHSVYFTFIVLTCIYIYRWPKRKNLHVWWKTKLWKTKLWNLKHNPWNTTDCDSRCSVSGTSVLCSQHSIYWSYLYNELYGGQLFKEVIRFFLQILLLITLTSILQNWKIDKSAKLCTHPYKSNDNKVFLFNKKTLYFSQIIAITLKLQNKTTYCNTI